MAQKLANTGTETATTSDNANTSRKHIAAAIIAHDNKILAAQRSYGMKDKWEFPGGKIEEGETPEEACRRECKEELGLELGTMWQFSTEEYDYPEFHCTMELFFAVPAPEQEPQMLEHEALRWLGRNELSDVDWLGADLAPIRQLGLYWDDYFSDMHM